MKPGVRLKHRCNHREQRQWQVSKLELEQDCAQRLLLVVLANVVQECIRSVVDDIHSDLMLPQAFAVRLLTKSIASTRRCYSLPTFLVLMPRMEPTPEVSDVQSKSTARIAACHI